MPSDLPSRSGISLNKYHHKLLQYGTTLYQVISLLPHTIPILLIRDSTPLPFSHIIYSLFKDILQMLNKVIHTKSNITTTQKMSRKNSQRVQNASSPLKGKSWGEDGSRLDSHKCSLLKQHHLSGLGMTCCLQPIQIDPAGQISTLSVFAVPFNNPGAGF